MEKRSYLFTEDCKQANIVKQLFYVRIWVYVYQLNWSIISRLYLYTQQHKILNTTYVCTLNPFTAIGP